MHILKPPPQLLIRRIKPVIYHSISEAYHGSVIPVPISKSIRTAAGAAWSTPCIAYLLLCHAFRNSVAVPHFIIVIATIFSNLLSFIIQSKFYFLSIFCRLNIKFVGTAATNIPAIINPIHCFFITLLLLIKYFHRFFFGFLLNLSLSDNPCLVKLQHHTASICYSITPACFLSHNYQSVAYSVFSTSAAPFW